MQMHADQVEVTEWLVRGLLGRQLPAFAQRGLRTVAAVLDDLGL